MNTNSIWAKFVFSKEVFEIKTLVDFLREEFSLLNVSEYFLLEVSELTYMYEFYIRPHGKNPILIFSLDKFEYAVMNYLDSKRQEFKTIEALKKAVIDLCQDSDTVAAFDRQVTKQKKHEENLRDS